MSQGNRSTWKIVAIVVAAVTVLFVCPLGACLLFGGGVAGAVLTATAEPANQAKGFFADLRAQDFDGARARMSEHYQSTHDAAAFRRAVESHAELLSQTDDTLNSRSIQNASATMSGYLSTPNGSAPVVVTLSRYSGEWRIDSVTVRGAPLM